MNDNKKVLVLGSEGLIGSHLCYNLDLKPGYTPMRFDIKLPHSRRYDLTQTDTWLDSDMCEADFVVFLAFDVGGAKYLSKKEKDLTFKTNNMKIMENVFTALHKRKKPFIFASSMMTELEGSAYGLLKKLGDSFTKELGGISTRFWNVFGVEQPGLRAHATTDFLQKTMHGGDIQLLTTGEEVRQYMTADQVAWALITMIENHFEDKTLERSYDISSGKWMETRHMAQLCIDAVHGPGSRHKVIPGLGVDPIQWDSTIEPNLEAYKALIKGHGGLPDPGFRHNLQAIENYLRLNHE